MNLILLSLVIVSALPFIFSWRLYGAICLFIGFLQDPLRKIIPEQPVIISVLVAVFFVLAFLSVLVKKRGLQPVSLFSGQGSLRTIISLMIGIVILQSVLAFARTNSVNIVVAGLLNYLSPLVAVWLGANYFKRILDFDRVVLIYVCFVFLVCISVILSYLGINTSLFDSVGGDLEITATYVEGGILISHAGLMRTGEIAAWHMMTGAIAVFMMTVLKVGKQKWPSFYLILLPLFSIGIILTGRRKTFTGLILFISIYILISLWLKRKKGIKKIISSLITLGSIFVISQFIFKPKLFSDYLQRVQSLGNLNEIQDRVSVLGFTTILWAIQSVGIWGRGAGMTTQAAQGVVSGAGEGGLGKITFELGLPGLILFLFLIGNLGLYTAFILKQIKYHFPQHLPWVVVFVSFVIVNLFLYLIASQVYNDPFILIILGTCFGFFLSIPRLLATEIHLLPPINENETYAYS